jgi:hypothetical protein
MYGCYDECHKLTHNLPHTAMTMPCFESDGACQFLIANAVYLIERIVCYNPQVRRTRYEATVHQQAKGEATAPL